LSPVVAQDVQLRDELKQLKAEVAHWKNVVKQSESGGDAQQEVRLSTGDSVDRCSDFSW
jgi:hypothetical protein